MKSYLFSGEKGYTSARKRLQMHGYFSGNTIIKPFSRCIIRGDVELVLQLRHLDHTSAVLACSVMRGAIDLDRTCNYPGVGGKQVRPGSFLEVSF
jgi:hypothetical protein